MARGYQTADVQSLIQRKEGGPFGFLKQAFGNTMGKWAMDKRRPVGYETDKTAENIMGDPTEENWTNTTREALYAKLFGQKARFGEGIYTQDESGAYILNPDAEGEDAKKAKEIQIMMNESFAKAKKGKKVSHPNFPDAGESFYRGTDKTLGEAYYDEEGNVVDYWDIGLDKGEKVFDWKSIMPGGKPFVNKANLQRAIVSPFTTPATFTGKATDTGNILGKFAGFGGGDEDTPSVTTPVSRDAKVPIDEPKGESLFSKIKGKAGSFMGDIKQSLVSGGDEGGYGGGTGVKTPVSTVGDYKEAVTGKSSPISRKAPIEQTIERDGGGGRNYLAGAQDRLGKMFGAMKGAFKSKEGFQGQVSETGLKAPVEGPKGRNMDMSSIIKALGLGGDEEEEDYEATMMDRMKGLGYRGSAKQNVQLMQKMGGRGPSIVDYLKGQGQGSSMDARRKLWQQYG